MAGLYVHIPFCVRKCAYCDFLSFPCQEPPAEYLEALLQEIRLAGRLFPGQRYETLFIGGGTPSLLTGQRTTLPASTGCPLACKAPTTGCCKPSAGSIPSGNS